MTDHFQSPEGEKMTPGAKSWLVVEDDPINRRLAQITLTRLGYTAEIAVNGQIGVEMFTRKNYDFVLMDIMMPVMDGIEATKRIRKIEEERNIPPEKRVVIIAFTANAFEDDRTRFFSAGMNHYINKPLDVQELTKILTT